MRFSEEDYIQLSHLFDPRRAYPGYKPNVQEIPNGDGRVDEGKYYLHVAPKYSPPDYAMDIYARAFTLACLTAEHLGVSRAFMPSVEDSTLRVLHYNAGIGGHEHTDFDLFTLNLWRSEPLFGKLQIGEIGEMAGLGEATVHSVKPSQYTQHSLVFFAMPSLTTGLPGGKRVGQWLHERKTRSRT